VPYAHRWII
jgi:hypothetical protein